MSRIEERLLQRFSGARIALASLALGLAGLLPLILYSAFGPAKGNPIGLGLLAMATVPVSAVGLFVGLVKVLVERFDRRE
jgi:hypothetical protein